MFTAIGVVTILLVVSQAAAQSCESSPPASVTSCYASLLSLADDVSAIVEICETGCIDDILDYLEDCPAAIPFFGGQEAVTGLSLACEKCSLKLAELLSCFQEGEIALNSTDDAKREYCIGDCPSDIKDFIDDCSDSPAAGGIVDILPEIEASLEECEQFSGSPKTLPMAAAVFVVSTIATYTLF